VSTKEFIRAATALPAEERALVVDSPLRTLHEPDPEVDRAWTDVAERRLSELRSGRVRAVAGEEVFAKARARLAG
jgi:hypothetical protein